MREHFKALKRYVNKRNTKQVCFKKFVAVKFKRFEFRWYSVVQGLKFSTIETKHKIFDDKKTRTSGRFEFLCFPITV